jgi:hypothetical protein
MGPQDDPSKEEQPGLEEAAVAKPDTGSAVEGPRDSGQPLFMWADIFFAMLSEPEKTFAILAEPTHYEPDSSALFGAGLLVALASMVGDLADAAIEGARPSLFELIGGLCGALFFWFCLALLLKFLAVLLRRPVSLKTSSIVTGWAFLPLIFKAPFMCISITNWFWEWLMIIPMYWYLVLEVQAFDSVLKLGRLRMIVLAIIVPPLVVLTYFFWLMVSAGLAIAAVASMFPNAFS